MNSMEQSYITHIGVANPDTKLTQEETALHMADMLELSAHETKRLVRLYRKTDIHYRYTVFSPSDKSLKIPFLSTAERMQIYERHALSLALKAIENGIEPHYLPKITHIITVSCTGMYAPGLDIE